MISKVSKAVSNVYGKRELSVERHLVCKEEEMERGEARSLRLRGRRVAVIRLEDGAYRAVANTCPHEAARMSDGGIERMWRGERVGEHQRNGRHVIICPWHNFEFDLDTGLSVCEPDRMRLKTYRVKVENGEVAVYV